MSQSPSSLRARELLSRRAVADLPNVESLAESVKGNPEAAKDAFFGVLLEGAFLVASADGQLEKEEVGELADLISKMTGEMVSPGDLADMVAAYSARYEQEGRAGRIAAMTAAVTEPAKRREVLGFAALVALSDSDLAPSELFVLHSIAKGFGLTTGDVNEIIRGLRAALA
jgi:tellurite resistance protein